VTRLSVIIVALLVCFAGTAQAQSTCDPDGVQSSGSIYRICMPSGAYNGNLVIWAHGFQDAGTPVGIPEDQLCLSGFCINTIINQLGFAFATNSYSKTGLAVLQGKDDILDLVNIFVAQKGQPKKVFLVGASEGGLVTALSLEQNPEIFSAGVAACGPIGSFPLELDYFGDARATFQYFFPGLIPGDVFHPDPGLVSIWSEYYEQVVKPVVFDPANRHTLDQWVKVARLPFDADNYLDTVSISVTDVLRYSVVNITDAAVTLGGFPYENRTRHYTGSDDDVLLNQSVARVTADPSALAAMNQFYRTTGILQRPLITLHTLRDQQVPYWHETLYNLKTLASGSFLTRHLNIPVDRFEHCNFTKNDALFSFAVMLFYDGVLKEVSGTSSYLQGQELASFELQSQSIGLPTRRGGALAFKLRQ
jgi:pimeloyl-ACP methyl ester carboxylesterase